MKKLLLSLLLMLACSLPVQAAERYSVDLENVKKKDAIDFIVNDLIYRGFSIMTINDYQIIMRKDADDFASKALYGSDFNRTPEFRLEINLAQLSNDLKLVAFEKIVTNPNSAYEKSSSSDDPEIQRLLNTYKERLERRSTSKKLENDIYSSRFGFTYSTIPNSNDLLVRGSSEKTEAYGLLFFGDRIIKFNNIPIKGIDDFTNKMNSIESFTLTIVRDEKEINIPLAKN